MPNVTLTYYDKLPNGIQFLDFNDNVYIGFPAHLLRCVNGPRWHPDTKRKFLLNAVQKATIARLDRLRLRNRDDLEPPRRSNDLSS